MPAQSSHPLWVNDLCLHLLPEKAIFIEAFKSLLVSDIHLGKSETFQTFGIPIPNTVNQENLHRLHSLCHRYAPDQLFILGDLFHSPQALVDSVIEGWVNFVNAIAADIYLIVGNHDRPFIEDLGNLLLTCCPEAIALDQRLVLSHEPLPHSEMLNICGHIHPCVQLTSRTDRLRLPCFYLEKSQNRLTLPSFGEFTGGYPVALNRDTMAYAIADNTVISLDAPTP